MQRQEQRTHLPSTFAGAPTPRSCPKTEAAGAAVRVGGVKVEGAVLAGVTLDARNTFLKIWPRRNLEQFDTTWAKTFKEEVLDPQRHEKESPCRGTSRCLGGTHLEWHHHGCSCMVYTGGSGSILEHSDYTAAHRFEVCNYKNTKSDTTTPKASPAVRAYFQCRCVCCIFSLTCTVQWGGHSQALWHLWFQSESIRSYRSLAGDDNWKSEPGTLRRMVSPSEGDRCIFPSPRRTGGGRTHMLQTGERRRLNKCLQHCRWWNTHAEHCSRLQ